MSDIRPSDVIWRHRIRKSVKMRQLGQTDNVGRKVAFRQPGHSRLVYQSLTSSLFYLIFQLHRLAKTLIMSFVSGNWSKSPLSLNSTIQKKILSRHRKQILDKVSNIWPLFFINVCTHIKSEKPQLYQSSCKINETILFKEIKNNLLALFFCGMTI